MTSPGRHKSERLRAVLDLAARIAHDEGLSAIEPEHLLAAVLCGPRSVGLHILACALGSRLTELRARFQSGTLEALDKQRQPDVPLSARGADVWRRAEEVAASWEKNFVGTEDLVIGLLDDERVLAIPEIGGETARELALRELERLMRAQPMPRRHRLVLGGMAALAVCALVWWIVRR